MVIDISSNTILLLIYFSSYIHGCF